MAPLQSFMCWTLETASRNGYIVTVILSAWALLLRLLDLAASISPDFEISMSFLTPWRAHAWEGFLATDIVMIVALFTLTIFSVFMVLLVTKRHYVWTRSYTHFYMVFLILYMIVELGVSIYEFSFYGNNTFRRAYVVFLWVFWIIRTLTSCVIVTILHNRLGQMTVQIENELRFSGTKMRNGYSY